jgi:Zinc knuckle.
MELTLMLAYLVICLMIVLLAILLILHHLAFLSLVMILWICLALALALVFQFVMPHLLLRTTSLRSKWLKLNKSLERSFKGKNTLDKILSEQRCILNKEGLGFIPKKGKKPSHHATRFVKSNGKHCSKCREVGHLVSDCPGGKPYKTCMFDSHYMLRKAYDGSIVARYVGSPILGGKKNAILVPKALVSNLQGPK